MRKRTVRGIIIKDNKVAVIKRIREKNGKVREYYVSPNAVNFPDGLFNNLSDITP